MLLRRLWNLFRSFQRKKFPELKYIEKYKDVIDWKEFEKVIFRNYSGPIVFEPLRSVNSSDQAGLFAGIDNSADLSHQEKAEAVIGLACLLSGSFPERSTIALLEKVFGKQFGDAVEQKRKELGHDIAVSKVRRLIRYYEQQK